MRSRRPAPYRASTKRIFLAGLAATLCLAATGHGVLHAATCTASNRGTCHACKNCKYCKHCAKNGGKCSVCR